MPVPEQRASERYPTQMPALLTCQEADDRQRPILMLTRDVSSTGAYFHTREPFFEEEDVQVEMLIRIESAEDNVHHMYLETMGEITRRDSSGVAVRFIGPYRLTPFV